MQLLYFEQPTSAFAIFKCLNNCNTNNVKLIIMQPNVKKIILQKDASELCY